MTVKLLKEINLPGSKTPHGGAATATVRAVRKGFFTATGENY